MAGAEVTADVQYGFWANMYAIQYISLRFYKEMLKNNYVYVHPWCVLFVAKYLK